MKTFALSTAVIALSAGMALAQTSTPPTDGDTQAPLTGENMTPSAETLPTEPATPETAAPDVASASDAREGYSPMMTEALTADLVEGADVYSSENENVGSISELVLDAQGQITQVVVDIGGFLGIGARPVALTLSELELMQATDGDEVRAFAPMTRAQLEALPEYEG